jgi:ribosomal protein S27AE
LLSPERVAVRRAYTKTLGGKQKRKEAKDRWWQRNPDKRKASGAVNSKIQNGLLVAQPCENCGAPKAEAHHEDYSKPLDITWLCTKCHVNLHKEKRQPQGPSPDVPPGAESQSAHW